MSTGTIRPVASDEGLACRAGGLKTSFLMFDGTGSHRTNGSSLLGKILTNKNLIFLYLNFLVVCKSLIVLLSKSIMFNIFL